MNKIVNSISLRAGISIALCASFIIYPLERFSPARAATACAAADLKSESEYRNEASRYDASIRAISGIATMKLETGEDLKKALVILDRERQNLRFHFSKLVILVLSDSTYTDAIKKKTPDRQAAEALARELQADRKAVLKLNGAEPLAARIQRSAESDAATLQRVAERLKEAAERIKKAGQRSAAPDLGATGKFRMMLAFSEARAPVDAHHTLALTPQRRGADLSNRIVRALIIVVPIILRTELGQAVLDIFRPFEQEDVDQVAACQEGADARYLTCVSAANNLPAGFPFFQREVAVGLCYSQWLADQAACLILII
jgi:hypothetical protein